MSSKKGIFKTAIFAARQFAAGIFRADGETLPPIYDNILDTKAYINTSINKSSMVERSQTLKTGIDMSTSLPADVVKARTLKTGVKKTITFKVER